MQQTLVPEATDVLHGSSWSKKCAALFRSSILKIQKAEYDGDQNNGLVWYSGHEHLSDHRIVHYSNGVLNDGQNCPLIRLWLE